MAQVKVQTSAPLAGTGLSPGVPPTAMTSPGSLGLQPSVNGTGPAPTPACAAPAGGFGDAPVSGTLPGRSKRLSSGKFKEIFLLESFIFIHQSITVRIFFFIMIYTGLLCTTPQSQSDIFQTFQTMCWMQNNIFKDCSTKFNQLYKIYERFGLCLLSSALYMSKIMPLGHVLKTKC